MPLPIKNLMANWQTLSSRNVCTFCKFWGRASLRLVEFLAFWHLAWSATMQWWPHFLVVSGNDCAWVFFLAKGKETQASRVQNFFTQTIYKNKHIDLQQNVQNPMQFFNLFKNSSVGKQLVNWPTRWSLYCPLGICIDHLYFTTQISNEI